MRRQLQPRARREHGLVGQVDHGARVRGEPLAAPRRADVPLTTAPAVVRRRIVEHAGAHLLLPAAEHHARQPALGVEAVERVAHRGRVVLAVDQRDDGAGGHGAHSAAVSAARSSDISGGAPILTGGAWPRSIPIPRLT